MPTVKQIFDYLDAFAPVSLKMSFDNVGFLVGEADAEVKRAVVSLDITDEVIDEAVSLGAQLIVSHHPLIFTPLKSVTDQDIKGRKVLKLIKNGISAICMHTNLDIAAGGVNDALAAAVGLENTVVFTDETVMPNGAACGLGRIGELKEAVSLQEYLPFVKKALNSCVLRYHDAGRPVKKVAVLGGSGGDCVQLAFDAGCDTYITADIKYDPFLDAKALGINLIDADHFCTENVVTKVLLEKLQTGFPEVVSEISKVHAQTVHAL